MKKKCVHSTKEDQHYLLLAQYLLASTFVIFSSKLTNILSRYFNHFYTNLEIIIAILHTFNTLYAPYISLRGFQIFFVLILKS